MKDSKNWNAYVTHAEDVARSPGFARLRDTILVAAAPNPQETAIDLGSGTGLLTLALAEQVRRVWAVDIAQGMSDYLRTKLDSAGHANVSVVTASAVSLPLVDASVDLVVSNYCLHHLDDEGKSRALAEIRRVLRPGGRFVFADMMFDLHPGDPRSRAVIGTKVRAFLRRGPAGWVRLGRNAARVLTGRWESPSTARWWEQALRTAGFIDVEVHTFSHEGGLATMRAPGAVTVRDVGATVFMPAGGPV